MKGIILAGGNATRLFPLTHTTCKQLLPVYDRQMIFYPLNKLILAGIDDILIIVSPHYAGQFLSLLGPIFDGTKINLQFKVQAYPRGLADAFILGADFIDDDSVALVLGDNIFEDDFFDDISDFETGCHIFLKEVEDPSRYGVAKLFDGKIESIVEKPKQFISPYAVVGFYLFDNNIISVAKSLSASDRGELEIVDAIRMYAIFPGKLNYTIIDGEWYDAGTFNDLIEANVAVRKNSLLRANCKTIEQGLARFNEEQIQMLRKQLK